MRVKALGTVIVRLDGEAKISGTGRNASLRRRLKQTFADFPAAELRFT